MTTQTYSISDLLNGKVTTDSDVKLNGWVKTRRDSKAGFSFINLHDGSCFSPIQVVVQNDIDNYQDEILKLTAGASISVNGKLVESPGKGQAYEVQATTIKVIGWVDDPETYPIQAKHHTLEYLREVSHLRPRTNTIGAATRIKHSVSQAIHQFFHQNGFYWVHTPIITANDCEGAGELFRVSTLDLENIPRDDKNKVNFEKDFFSRETFLTVSGQLNVECFCMALSKVYTFGPTFRAENSHTSRHLAEFWMVEPEIAFANLNDLNQLSEQFLKHILKTLLNERLDDLEFFNQRVDKECLSRLESIVNSSFEVLSYTDAITILEKSSKKFEFEVKWGIDLQSEHERYLAEEHIGSPVIVTDYPKEVKGFYMRLNDDQKTVAAMDLLVPGIGEIIGGSQREERLDIIDQRIKEANMNPKQYSWYRDLRRYGTVPHAGFGLGLERLINYITGLGNIRDVIAFPRTPGNANF